MRGAGQCQERTSGSSLSPAAATLFLPIAPLPALGSRGRAAHADELQFPGQSDSRPNPQRRLCPGSSLHLSTLEGMGAGYQDPEPQQPRRHL